MENRALSATVTLSAAPTACVRLENTVDCKGEVGQNCTQNDKDDERLSTYCSRYLRRRLKEIEDRE